VKPTHPFPDHLIAEKCDFPSFVYYLYFLSVMVAYVETLNFWSAVGLKRAASDLTLALA
jgi:hypothetical protein